MKQYGDITKLDGAKLDPVDLIVRITAAFGGHDILEIQAVLIDRFRIADHSERDAVTDIRVCIPRQRKSLFETDKIAGFPLYLIGDPKLRRIGGQSDLLRECQSVNRSGKFDFRRNGRDMDR